jgi:hypothetical protein
LSLGAARRWRQAILNHISTESDPPIVIVPPHLRHAAADFDAQIVRKRSCCMNEMSRRRALLGLLATGSSAIPTFARAAVEAAPPPYSEQELIDSGNNFFGTISRGLGEAVEEATKRWGSPNAYVLGQEASGAFAVGARYGEGVIYTRNAGDRRVFWEGPSLGFDWGADGDRTMVLVYNLPSVSSLFRRFAGVNGSAYLVGGFGFTALSNGHVVVVPIRTGVGARLGVNVGYVKFTNRATWNPF